MNEHREAQALARHLDSLMGGQEGAVWSPTSSPASAEIAALSEVGESLADVQFVPRPAHRAAFDGLLQKYRPILNPRGPALPFSPGGVPLYVLLVTAALIIGSLAFKASLAPVPVRESRTPQAMPEQTASLPAPARPLTVTVRSFQQTPTPAPASVLMPAASVTPTTTITPTMTYTPTATVTPAAALTPTTTVTPTATVTPAATLTPTTTVTPTATITPALRAGRLDLAFHPEHLNAGGVCKTVYSASGSLKNHGSAQATGIDIGLTVVEGAQWVERVEVSPSHWAELGTSKPGRLTVYVHTNDAWLSAGKGAQIVVQLAVQEDAQATFTVKSQCRAEKPKDQADKPDKSEPGKPDKDKPGKPDKPQKNKGALLPRERGFWASLLSQPEV